MFQAATRRSGSKSFVRVDPRVKVPRDVCPSYAILLVLLPWRLGTFYKVWRLASLQSEQRFSVWGATVNRGDMVARKIIRRLQCLAN